MGWKADIREPATCTCAVTDRETKKKTKNQEAPARPSYLPSSDGHLGLLIYRLVTETAYHQQPRPSAHAHREGLIWIFEGKTHTLTHFRTHTPHKSWPVIALHCLAVVAFPWCDCQQMASIELC